MISLTPALLLSAANSAMHGDRKVPEVSWVGQSDEALRDNHRPGDFVGTAAFISAMGYASHRVSRDVSIWPLPPVADCTELGEVARSRQVLSESTPEPGTILLRWSAVEERYVRASIVVSCDGGLTPRLGWIYVCEVIEGHARVAAPEEAMGAPFKGLRRARRICIPRFNDRFVDWVALDGRLRLGRAA